MTESTAADPQRPVPPGATPEPDPAEAERDPAAAGADATADPATLAHAVEATLHAAADGPGGLTSPEDEADAVTQREIDAVGPESVPEEMLASPTRRAGSAPRAAVPVQRATDLTGVLTLKHEDLFLLTDPFGDIHPDGRGLGLYRGDTRILSHYEVRLNGERPVILRTGTGGSYAGKLQLTNPAYRRNPHDKSDESAVLRGRSLGIVRDRVVADGFHERIKVDNFTTHPERFEIVLRLDADFADIFEVRGMERPRGERLLTSSHENGVAFAYRGLDGVERRTYVAFSDPMTRLEDESRFRVEWEIPPGGTRTLEITVWGVEGEEVAALAETLPEAPFVREDVPSAAHRSWRASSTAVTVTDAFAARAVKRALSDLRLLVNRGPGEDERYIAAGVPWFSCLFGRDSIITAMQLLSIRPQVAVDTLRVLARLQAVEPDDWRDAQPGKVLHELRTGELARAREIPHSPYYGSVDATPLWLVLLGETYRWTGDWSLVDELWPNALAALEWIERHGDANGDGFVEYERRSPRGLVNQGWKDSVEANRFRDGRLPQSPLALVEVQAYVYAARRAIAELARVRGEDELAKAQEAAAEELRRRFEDAFWMEDAGTYAMAIDRDGAKVDAISSNPGHALWCGIVSTDRAARVATTMTSPGLWSGWGVRTLSSAMAGYNPIGYHIGSVWPHDNAIIADGLARYGHREEATRIAAALLEATQFFRDARLPELFCGFSRDDSPYPVPYPVACSPQAWAAGSIFQLLDTMLGMRPNAPARQLELVAPALPEWLPEVRLDNLRVGEAVADLRFRREAGATSVEVLRRTGELSLVVRM